jgi:hypothetical protein
LASALWQDDALASAVAPAGFATRRACGSLVLVALVGALSSLCVAHVGLARVGMLGARWWAFGRGNALAVLTLASGACSTITSILLDGALSCPLIALIVLAWVLVIWTLCGAGGVRHTNAVQALADGALFSVWLVPECSAQASPLLALENLALVLRV